MGRPTTSEEGVTAHAQCPDCQRKGEVRCADTYRPSRGFPAERAFVVQVVGAEPGVPDVPLGRAEHVVSGTATHFANWAELVAFIEQVLAQVEQHPP